jgi:hypothetical protein
MEDRSKLVIVGDGLELPPVQIEFSASNFHTDWFVLWTAIRMQSAGAEVRSCHDIVRWLAQGFVTNLRALRDERCESAVLKDEDDDFRLALTPGPPHRGLVELELKVNQALSSRRATVVALGRGSKWATFADC